VETLEDPDGGYGPNYAGALGIPKMESYIQMYNFMNLMPRKKDF